MTLELCLICLIWWAHATSFNSDNFNLYIRRFKEILHSYKFELLFIAVCTKVCTCDFYSKCARSKYKPCSPYISAPKCPIVMILSDLDLSCHVISQNVNIVAKYPELKFACNKLLFWHYSRTNSLISQHITWLILIYCSSDAFTVLCALIKIRVRFVLQWQCSAKSVHPHHFE